jgi:hypothetical protein
LMLQEMDLARVVGDEHTELGTRLAVGDLDGDGEADLWVGVPGGALAGEALLYLGPFVGTLSPGDAAATYRGIDGEQEARVGERLAFVGELDRDGFGVFAIPDPGLSGVLLFKGATSGMLEVADAYVKLYAPEIDAPPFSIQSVRDIDGDGLDDLAVGLPGLDDTRGVAIVVLGGTVGRASVEDAASAQLIGGTARGAALSGSGNLGTSLAGAGDVDRDGHPDLVVGAPFQDSGTWKGSGGFPVDPGEGAAWLVYGPLTGVIELGSMGARLIGPGSMTATGTALAGGLRVTVWSGVGPLIGLAVLAGVNQVVTGDPMVLPQAAYFSEGLPPIPSGAFRYGPDCNGLGFGDAIGCFPTYGDLGHTPAKALRSVGRNLFAASRLWLGHGALWLFAFAAWRVSGARPLLKRGAALWVLVIVVYALYWVPGLAYGARFHHSAAPVVIIACSIGVAMLLA